MCQTIDFLTLLVLFSLQKNYVQQMQCSQADAAELRVVCNIREHLSIDRTSHDVFHNRMHILPLSFWELNTCLNMLHSTLSSSASMSGLTTSPSLGTFYYSPILLAKDAFFVLWVCTSAFPPQPIVSR